MEDKAENINICLFKMKKSNFKLEDFHFIDHKENIDKYIDDLISEFVEIKNIKCTSFMDLIQQVYENDVNFKNYFDEDNRYFQRVKIYENEKAVYDGNYCYTVSESKKPDYVNLLGTVFSKKKEPVYCDFLVFKYSNVENDDEVKISIDEIKEIIKSRLIFNGVYFDKTTDFIGCCEFYSDNIGNYGCGAAMFMEKQNLKYKEVMYDNNILKILYNTYENDNKESSVIFEDDDLQNYKKENEKYYKFIADYFERVLGKEVNVKKAIMVFYYRIHNHEFVWNLSLKELCQMIQYYYNENKELETELMNENEQIENMKKQINPKESFNFYKEIKTIQI